MIYLFFLLVSCYGSGQNSEKLVAEHPFLIVIPEWDKDNAGACNANFHLKNNYFFDFAMRVGGVKLTKIESSIK